MNWLLIFIGYKLTCPRFLLTSLFNDAWGMTWWLSIFWFCRRMLPEFRLVFVWV